ncbi:atrial natriuretic peptide receptor 1-like [Paramacrobiotus metropolitanus]|uniref:atrial natriuretic peptide receptor 1-like n=1 Tax=Paramacrobiotus metropolitanus TaxID=2943436 RepID=UPI00244563C2|nr:atrial natriuretic peptide receptor 1-like [Paramacrobiotus metropolitanus]
MANGEFVYITVEPYPHPSWGNYSWKFNDDLDEILEETWRSVLVITLAETETGRLQILAPRFPVWKARAKEVYGFDIPDDESINFSQLSAYEAMSIFSKVLREAIVEQPLRNWSNGTEFAERFHNRKVDVVTGPVRFSEDGSRRVNLVLRDYNTTTGRLEPVLLYDSLTNALQSLGPIDWPYRDTPPPDAPVCGFSGGLCALSNNQLYTTVVATVCALLFLLLGFGAAFRKCRQTKKELTSRRWEINRANLKCPDFHSLIVSDGSAGSLRLRRRHMHDKKPSLPLPLGERKSDISVFTIDHKGHFPHGEMSYNDRQVWAKEIPCMYPLDELPKSATKILAQLIGLYHQNVNTFIGICTAYDGVSMLFLDEYCKRGSLHDMLSTQKPDPELKKSFVQDIIFGLRFLHEATVKMHGFLTSSCCLIDGRFILKIAKVCQHKVTKILSGAQKSRNFKFADLFWTAPERILQAGKAEPTQKSDIYSMAIIIAEIYMGTLLYNQPPEDLYEQITVAKNISCRPFIDHSHVPDDLIPVLQNCWHEKPTSRPTIQQAQTSIFRKLIISGRDKLVDKMLKRLETYSEDLEVRVYERTLELQREQRESDSLLAEVFPKSFVQRLRMREYIKPEMFEQVTVYFSDIIGFAEIVNTATPYEVISFLGSTYAAFDQIIPSFDVYKVETINDSYVVASGLPIKNGDNHALEIVAMACFLMKVYYKSIFRGETDLRIGIHTGPLAAGIVGTKAPRYCLFGDTMNTASRMESHGEAGRIHISSQTAALIGSAAKFVLQPRGHTVIKGKGEMFTFWLEWHLSFLDS